MRSYGRVVEILDAHVRGAKDSGFRLALCGEWKPERAALLVPLHEMRAFRPERRVLGRVAFRADQRVVLRVYPDTPSEQVLLFAFGSNFEKVGRAISPAATTDEA